MKQVLQAALFSLLLVSLASCDTVTEPQADVPTGNDSSMTETRNVLYQGIVRAGGGSIRGATHRLIVSEERIIGLESDTVTLNDYVAAEVEVLGAVRVAENDRDTIMRVESIARLDAPASVSSSEESSSSSADDTTSSAISSTSSDDDSATEDSSSSSVAAVSSSVSVAATSSSAEIMQESDATVQLMAAANISADQWTQQYCSSHIGFCIPVHRNWWYTSFGTTSSTLWHVEVGPQQITDLGDGPLTVNVVSGSLAATGHTDGDVSVQGGRATGYRTWDDTRHIEIEASAALEGAVRYMTQALSRTED